MYIDVLFFLISAPFFINVYIMFMSVLVFFSFLFFGSCWFIIYNHVSGRCSSVWCWSSILSTWQAFCWFIFCYLYSISYVEVFVVYGRYCDDFSVSHLRDFSFDCIHKIYDMYTQLFKPFV